jgi:hypothetical protein
MRFPLGVLIFKGITVAIIVVKLLTPVSLINVIGAPTRT